MRHQEAILCTATVMPLCFWIIIFTLSDSSHTTGISVGSEVSLFACQARPDVTPTCSSDRIPQKPRSSPYDCAQNIVLQQWTDSSLCPPSAAPKPPPSAALSAPTQYPSAHCVLSTAGFLFSSFCCLHLSAEISPVFHALLSISSTIVFNISIILTLFPI